MEVGDLIGIGWNGVTKQPFVAVIKKVHYKYMEENCYTVYIPATGKETFIIERDVEVLDESR
jgi:hypothetical protein